MEKNDGIHMGSSPRFSTKMIAGRYHMIIDKEELSFSHRTRVQVVFYDISHIMEIPTPTV